MNIFGQDNSSTFNGDLASSEYLIISVGGELNMVQSLNMDVGREVTPVAGVGHVGVIYVWGRVTGSAAVIRAVGSGQNMLSWASGSECGKFGAFTVRADGGACSPAAGTVTSNQAVLQKVGIQASAQSVTVTDSASFLLTDISSS